MISALVLVVATLVFLAIKFGKESDLTTRTDTTSTTEPPKPTAATLAIDARPWGEVQQIVDEAGKNWLQTPQHTPMILQLAPGRYTLSVRSADSRMVSLKAEVTSGQLTSSVATFKIITPDEYFRSIGWE